MNLFGDSIITVLLMALYFSLLMIFFNFARKTRLKMHKKKLIKEVQQTLELEELPLHKNKEINWETIERKAKKLPDSREKYILIRRLREQIQFAKIKN